MTTSEVAVRLGLEPEAPVPGSTVGLAKNVGGGTQPINGLRHPSAGSASGWFIWAGDNLSSSEDFFEPSHIEHLVHRCPAVIPYLGLPAGYRFLIADDYEDVWFDASLLDM